MIFVLKKVVKRTRMCFTKLTFSFLLQFNEIHLGSIGFKLHIFLNLNESKKAKKATARIIQPNVLKY